MGIKYEEADHDLLLTSLGWMNVKQLVYYDTASFMYKITDETVPEYTQSVLDKCDTIHSHETRSAKNGNFITPKINSPKGQTAFVYSDAQVWNILPLRIKEAQSIDIFPERLKGHIFMIEDIEYALINRARGPYEEIFVLTFKAYGPNAVIKLLDQTAKYQSFLRCKLHTKVCS